MLYDNRPLFPPYACTEDESLVRVPLFSHGCERPHRRPGRPEPPCGCEQNTCGGQTVRVRNPNNPAEYALVTLNVDDCGNLTICLRRDMTRPTHCR